MISRTQALVVACDIMKFSMKYVPLHLIFEASERLHDKKASVKKKALRKLIEVYQDYCDKYSEGDMTINDYFEQISCKILLLCCDKHCEEFRSQNLELVLSDDHFPHDLPVEERMQQWFNALPLYMKKYSLEVTQFNFISEKKRSRELELKEKELQSMSSNIDKKIKTFEAEKSKAGDLTKLVEECTEDLRSNRNQLTLHKPAE